MPEFEVKAGKNGVKIMRRKGRSVITCQWNAQTGEPEADNELTERIAACLNYFEGLSTAAIKERQNWGENLYDMEIKGYVYDYNRYGLAAFQSSNPSIEEREQLEKLANLRKPVIVRVWIDGHL